MLIGRFWFTFVNLETSICVKNYQEETVNRKHLCFPLVTDTTLIFTTRQRLLLVRVVFTNSA